MERQIQDSYYKMKEEEQANQLQQRKQELLK